MHGLSAAAAAATASVTPVACSCPHPLLLLHLSFPSLLPLSPSCRRPAVAPVCRVRLLPKDRNGYIKAECLAVASPRVSSYKWLRDNQTSLLSLEDERSSSSDVSILTIPVDATLESYACVASNIIGSSTCRLQAHQIQGNALCTATAQQTQTCKRRQSGR